MVGYSGHGTLYFSYTTTLVSIMMSTLLPGCVLCTGKQRSARFVVDCTRWVPASHAHIVFFLRERPSRQYERGCVKKRQHIRLYVLGGGAPSGMSKPPLEYNWGHYRHSVFRVQCRCLIFHVGPSFVRSLPQIIFRYNVIRGKNPQKDATARELIIANGLVTEILKFENHHLSFYPTRPVRIAS